jgi:protein-S-isoprenylcysteine O-methyltransferase Ste14
MSERKGPSPAVAAIVFFLLIPLPMAGVIPWWITRWQWQPPLLGIEAGRWLGAIAVALGAPLLVWSVVWLAREGVKPYPPIQRLVTNGPYAYTRNPMYLGVVMVMMGQGLLFGSRGVFIYGLCWLMAFQIFERTADDPFIRKHIGPPYDEYMKAVPGWIPRRPRRVERVDAPRS